MATPNGLYPLVRTGKGGDIYRAVYLDDGTGQDTGTISAFYQAPGDPAPRGPQMLNDPNYNPIAVQGVGFDIDQIAEGAARWTLTCLAVGDTEFSEWLSADDGGLPGMPPTFVKVGPQDYAGDGYNGGGLGNTSYSGIDGGTF